MKWRLVEEFGLHCITETDDGRLLFTADYTDMENLVTWLMTFGAKAEVLPKGNPHAVRKTRKRVLTCNEVAKNDLLRWYHNKENNQHC